MPPKKSVLTIVPATVLSQRRPEGNNNGSTVAGSRQTVADKISGLLRSSPIVSIEETNKQQGETENASHLYPLLLHSLYFVAATWRAQLHIPAFVASASDGPAPLPAPSAIPSASPAEHSVAFERRFVQAVALHTGHTFTLDHVARVAALFPHWVMPSWFLCSQQQQGGDGNSSDSTQLIASQQQFRSDICCRINLPLDRIPTAEEARLEMQSRHPSAEVIARIVATHCAQSALEDQWRATRDEIVPMTLPSPSPGKPVKRPRSASPSRAMMTNGSSQLSFLTSVPESLRDALSSDKLGAVLASLDAESRAAENNEQARIAAAIDRERLLGFFDLVRATFGVSKQAVGGEKLISILVSQNNFAADEISVRRQLWRLLELSSVSGIRAALDSEAVSEGSAVLTQDSLHLAVFSLDRLVSSRSHIARELANN